MVEMYKIKNNLNPPIMHFKGEITYMILEISKSLPQKEKEV